MDGGGPIRGRKFLPTPSARRATYCPECRSDVNQISTHALREEGDALPQKPSHRPPYFYPRPPRGGRRSCERAPAASP